MEPQTRVGEQVIAEENEALCPHCPAHAGARRVHIQAFQDLSARKRHQGRRKGATKGGGEEGGQEPAEDTERGAAGYCKSQPLELIETEGFEGPPDQ